MRLNALERKREDRVTYLCLFVVSEYEPSHKMTASEGDE